MNTGKYSSGQSRAKRAGLREKPIMAKNPDAVMAWTELARINCPKTNGKGLTLVSEWRSHRELGNLQRLDGQGRKTNMSIIE